MHQKIMYKKLGYKKLGSRASEFLRKLWDSGSANKENCVPFPISSMMTHFRYGSGMTDGFLQRPPMVSPGIFHGFRSVGRRSMDLKINTRAANPNCSSDMMAASKVDTWTIRNKAETLATSKFL